MPKPKRKIADALDQKFFDFVDSKNSGLIFEKVGPNKYKFGTRQISAKLQNGNLLVRIGGGYQSIDQFFD